MLLALALGCTATTIEGTLSEDDAHAAILTVQGGPGEVDVRCVSAEGEVHRLSAPAAPATLKVRALLAEVEYTCEATIGGSTAAVAFTPPPLPAGLSLPAVSVVGDPAEVGFHLVNLAHLLDPETSGTYLADEYLVIFDALGRPRWQYAGVGGGDIDATWLGDGTILFGGAGVEASTAPTVVDLDGDVRLSGPSLLDTPYEVPASWNHDVGVSEDGETIWVLTREAIPMEEDPERTWEGFVVEELDRATGETLWAWSSMDDGVASGALDAGALHDSVPYHANAVWDVEEGGSTKVYVSLRNRNQVIRIDRASREVDLVVGLGGDLTLLDTTGAAASDGQWFFGQHDVKRIGDRLVLYDNGLGRSEYDTAPWARALVLTLDEDAGTARIETSWRGEEDWLAPAWGGLDRRDDGLLDLAIGHFWWFDDEAPERSALVLLAPTEDGGAETRWRLDFPDKEDAIYRSDTIAGCDFGALVDYCP